MNIDAYAMSEITIVQLVTGQRGRELRTQQQMGIIDWLFVPLFLAFAICWTALLFVIAIVSLLVKTVFRSEISSRDL